MIHIIGRVTKDLEVQTSQSGKKYISFDIAENKGFGEKAKTQFHRCTVWGEEGVERLSKAKVQKGSLLSVIGDQNISGYIRNTGEAGASSDITVWHWDYVPTGSKKSEGTSAADPFGDVPVTDCTDDLPL